MHADALCAQGSFRPPWRLDRRTRDLSLLPELVNVYWSIHDSQWVCGSQLSEVEPGTRIYACSALHPGMCTVKHAAYVSEAVP